MTSSQTFSDDMTKMSLYISIGIGIGSALLFQIVKAPLVIGLAMTGGLTLFFALALLVPFSFMTTRRVTCDASACEVVTKSRWRNFGSQRFRWDDVQATQVVVQQHQGYTRGSSTWYSVHLFVVVNGNEVELLRKQNMTRGFADLVATTNDMTPHLPYAWIKPKEVFNHRVLENNAYYCKVARRHP
jgi:hypothetical protein